LLAIVFTGGLGPSSQVVRRLVEPVAEDTIIIAADSGLLAAEGAGLKPTWITGDMDSLKTKSA